MFFKPMFLPQKTIVNWELLLVDLQFLLPYPYPGAGNDDLVMAAPGGAEPPPPVDATG